MRNTRWAGVLNVMAAEERGRPMLGLVLEALLCLLALQSIALLCVLLQGEDCAGVQHHEAGCQSVRVTACKRRRGDP